MACLKCYSVQDQGQQVYFLSNIIEEIVSLIEIKLISHQENDDGIICAQCFEEVMHEYSNTPAALLTPRPPEVDSDYNPLIPEQSCQTALGVKGLRDSNVCVWCRKSLFQRRSHAIPDGVIRDEISARIYPRVVHSYSLVCYACWTYASKHLQNTEDNRNTATTSQNTNICVWCTVSLTRRRSHSLPDGPEKLIIMERISPREIPVGGRVCYGCWVRAQRAVRRQTHDGEPQQEPRPGPSYQQSNECICCRTSLFHRRYHVLGQGPERDAVLSRIFPREIPTRALMCTSCWSQVQDIVINNDQSAAIDIRNTSSATIVLDNYKHTINTSSRCFVPECGNTERFCVPNYLKKRILTSQKLYVTDSARICAQHISVYDWDFLSQYDFINSFTQMEIEGMLRLSLQEESSVRRKKINGTQSMEHG